MTTGFGLAHEQLAPTLIDDGASSAEAEADSQPSSNEESTRLELQQMLNQAARLAQLGAPRALDAAKAVVTSAQTSGDEAISVESQVLRHCACPGGHALPVN